MNNLFNIFIYSLIQSPKITIIGCILFVMSLFILCSITVTLILDKIYRPNMPQYPFNNFLDRYIPILTLIMPTCIILFEKPFASWFSRLFLLILIHIVILIPLFNHWSNLRSWSINGDLQLYESWYHPRLYKHISIAVLYPLLWGLFFSLSRYLRLGTTYNIEKLIFTLPEDTIVVLFLIPHLILWFLIPLSYIIFLRTYLWDQLTILLYSLHIYLLKNNIYFKIMEFLYKMIF